MFENKRTLELEFE
jgi:ubiquitin related modifier 1